MTLHLCARKFFWVIDKNAEIRYTEGNRTTTVFLGKSGMIVDDLEGLYSVRDALNVAIDKMENKEVADEDDADWDE